MKKRNQKIVLQDIGVVEVSWLGMMKLMKKIVHPGTGAVESKIHSVNRAQVADPLCTEIYAIIAVWGCYCWNNTRQRIKGTEQLSLKCLGFKSLLFN